MLNKKEQRDDCLTKHLVRRYSARLGNKNNEGFSKRREDEIAKSSRNMTNDFECIITKVCVSKHCEEGIAKESWYVLNVILPIMNVCVYVFLWSYVFTCVCVWLVLVMLL